MSIEIAVGPPVLSINQGATFMVTDMLGEMASGTSHGLFSDDTRFVSHWAIFADGESWLRLTSAATSFYAAAIYLTNPHVKTERGEIPEQTVGLAIHRTVDGGVHEDLDVTNYGRGPVQFNLEIAMRADFADLFEVKTGAFVRRGRIVSRWKERSDELVTEYLNRDFRRSLVYRTRHCDSRPVYANGRISFRVALEAGASWHGCCEYVLGVQNETRTPQRGCHREGRETERDRLHREWDELATRVTTPNEDIYRFYRQSVSDMGALRLYEQDFASDVWLPAAGVPWFVAVFGRDSLVASLQNMVVNAGFARGTLKKLAELQATAEDDERDAQPGKMPHELRVGELAHFHMIPHTPYYGTADATPLYLIVLHEAWRWLGDESLLRQYRDVALRCLDWIDRFGDLDGDGFQEYKTRSSQGYENMSWKDAEEAVVDPKGAEVHQPKALCELQGYVFDAWWRMAEVFDALDEPDRANALRDKARNLQARFEERFWCEDAGTYAFTLDPDKHAVASIASNPGHLLWSGLPRPDRAARVVQRLLEPDMWSGWGIRTLSEQNPAFNPFSYQRGSVWPHDNGIIALGMKRYGFAVEAARVARDISEAASCFMGYRVPELYAGVARTPGSFPVLYPSANVPQAWAAGSIFHLLQAILGIQADAPHGRLLVDPTLPKWLPAITLTGLAVGNACVDLRFWREGDVSRYEANVREGELEVCAQAWTPWPAGDSA